MNSRKTTNGELQVHNQDLLRKAFYTGIFFILIVLLLNVIIENPNPYLYSTFKLVLSMGAAAFALGLTGILKIEIGQVVKTSGAIAVFVLVFYVYPTENNHNTIYPSSVNEEQCENSTKNVYMILYESTRLKVYQGDRIRVVSLDGKINFGPIVGVIGPEGKNSGIFGITLTRYNLIDEISHGALMYRLNYDEQWKKLVSVDSIVVKRDGFLEVDINDKEKANNFGFYLASLRISN